MKELNAHLYKSSLDDIEHMVECIEQFREFNIALKYTGREGFYSETIKLCMKELTRLVKKHEKDYDEKINLKTITEKVKNIGLSIKEALSMIQSIEKSLLDLSPSEQLFIDSIKSDSDTGRLSLKQTEWLKIIYERI